MQTIPFQSPIYNPIFLNLRISPPNPLKSDTLPNSLKCDEPPNPMKSDAPPNPMKSYTPNSFKTDADTYDLPFPSEKA